MVLLIQRSGSDVRTSVAYDGDMSMGEFIVNIVAPLFDLECVDGTVFGKLHSPDLRVVFNSECRARPLKELVDDWSVLILAHWPNDAITVRSLTGNAQGC
jgi:hypothetical protein